MNDIITENSALVPLCKDSHNGTFFANWDTGQGLAPVLGENSFSVLPSETVNMCGKSNKDFISF